MQGLLVQERKARDSDEDVMGFHAVDVSR